MRRLRILVVAASAAAATLLAPAAADARSTCPAPRGYEAAERSSEAVVWVRKSGPGRVWGCLHRVNRRILLGPASSGYRLAGRYVAYATSFFAGEGDERFVLFVVDLATDEDRTGPVWFDPDWSSDPAEGEGPPGSVTDLELKRNGSAAWISCRTLDIDQRCVKSEPYQVWRLDRRGLRMLEESTAVERYSLEREGSRISWRSGGRVREASLR